MCIEIAGLLTEMNQFILPFELNKPGLETPDFDNCLLKNSIAFYIYCTPFNFLIRFTSSSR